MVMKAYGRTGCENPMVYHVRIEPKPHLLLKPPVNIYRTLDLDWLGVEIGKIIILLGCRRTLQAKSS